MYTRPESIEDAAIRDAVRAGWGLDAVTAEYLPVGFGSHHWRVALADASKLFVTVDDLGSKDFLGPDAPNAFNALSRAFRVVHALQDRLPWVVAPRADVDGGVLRWLDARHSVAVFPHLAGTASRSYASDTERCEVAALIAELHLTPRQVWDLGRFETFALPHEADLDAALEELGEPWTGGPYAEPARRLLTQHAAGVTRILTDYRGLAARALHDKAAWTITHGEPHSSNVLRTRCGLRVIDWDTALVAPPERDLWMLLPLDGTGPTARRYAEATGHGIDTDRLRLYALWWDLCEIGIYVSQFRAPHRDTADTRQAWAGLREYVQADHRWPPGSVR